MTSRPSGISIPFRLDGSGRVATTSGPAKIEENLVHLLLTRVGERPMHRDVGCGLHDLVHDPDDDTLRALLRYRLTTAEQWEPRVGIRNVDVTRHDDLLLITVGYVLNTDDEYRAITVPVPVGLTPVPVV